MIKGKTYKYKICKLIENFVGNIYIFSVGLHILTAVVRSGQFFLSLFLKVAGCMKNSRFLSLAQFGKVNDAAKRRDDAAEHWGYPTKESSLYK